MDTDQLQPRPDAPAGPAPPAGRVARLAGRARSSPYYPALSHPVLRRVLPGAAASALGDGMSAVAIAWLALRLAPEPSRGLWVGASVAAYSLPGAIGAVALRRWLGGRGGARLTFVNAVLRAAALGLIACLALAGLLGPAGYVALLGVSSLLSAWGIAGKYTLIADLLPPEQWVAGNTVFGLADQLSLMIGPALAGTGGRGHRSRRGHRRRRRELGRARDQLRPHRAPRRPFRPAGRPSPHGRPSPGGRCARCLGGDPLQPGAAGLLALSFVFYLLYGPVEVALPVPVATDLHGSAALLGLFWAVFGVGAVIGELSAPFLRRWRVWPIMTGIVLGWGLALVPLGLVTPLWMALAAFFAGAVIWGPWMSLSMAVLQDASPPAALAQVIAARSSLLIIAAPLGTALGGPIVAALGARGTLLASALATVALGVVTAGFLAARRHRARR